MPLLCVRDIEPHFLARAVRAIFLFLYLGALS
jgi:hypothetical protein